MLYSYEAKDPQGRTVTGSIEADDERSAARYVHDIGYFVMRLSAMPGQAPPPPATGPAGYPMPPRPGGYPSTPPSPDTYSGPPRASAVLPATPTYTPSTSQTGLPNGFMPELSEMPTYIDRRPMTTGRWLMENIFLRLWSGVKATDLALFYRSFATLIDAGVPLRQSFDALGAQMPNGRIKAITKRMWQVVEAGGQISDAMAEFPWIFRVDHLALVKAGEASGNVDQMFLRIADTLEMEDRIKKDVIKEITLPIITFAGAFLLPPIFLVMVCGKLQLYVDQAIKPVATIAGVWFAIWVLCKLTSHVKYVTDTIAANIPVIQKPVRMIALAQFARTLSTLYSAGVSVPTSVRCAAEACGNAFLGRRLLSAIPMMESGYSIVDSLSRVHALPPIVMSMLGIGETTGSIDKMMDKVADHFEQEAMLHLHQLMVALRVVAIILIGIKVLIVLIQFYTAYAASALGNGPGPCGPGPQTGPLGHMGGDSAPLPDTDGTDGP